MSKQGSASRALHRAEQQGKSIVVGDNAPGAMRNRPVEFAPRSTHDPKPWRPVDGPLWVRLAGTQCRAVQR